MAKMDKDDISDFRQEGISNLIQNAVLHACMALAPVGIKLPGSGTHRIEQFCADILASLLSSDNRGSKKKKKKSELPEQSLLPEVEILNFYEGASTFKDFAKVICERLDKHYTNDDADTNPVLKKLCWEIYSECQKCNISYPKWLVEDSTYNLWLIFCSICSPLSEFIETEIAQDTLVRIFQFSGYSWNDAGSDLIPTQPMDFPMLLECLTKCFTTLDLHPSVVTEMIVDLKDELVCGVLRKGYMKKKGHKAPTIKRRWFVLTRNHLTYYESRDKMIEKGRITLNPSTTTDVLPDKQDKKHRFQLTCGESDVKYELYADDNKSRNEWILDIGKAIQLENAFQQNNDIDFIQSLSHFYRLRYGTVSTAIPRTDSLLQRMKWSCSPVTQRRISKISKGSSNLTQSCRIQPTIEANKVGAARTYTVGAGPRNTFNSTSSEQSDEERSIVTEGSSQDDEEYVYMYRGNTPGKHGDTEVPEDNVNVDNDTIFPYETINISSPQHSIKRNEKSNTLSTVHESPKDDKGNDLYLMLKPADKDTCSVNRPNDDLYLKLSDLGDEDESKGNGTINSDTCSPVIPPRPVETLSYSQSFSDSSPLESYSSGITRPLSVIFTSPHRTVSDTNTPVPPPRPVETLTTAGRKISQTVIPEEHETDENTKGQSMKSTEGSLRHPPYSEDIEGSVEHELYYIVPNFLNAS